MTRLVRGDGTIDATGANVPAEAPACKVCNAPGQIHRRRELVFGDITIEIEMPLCADCAEELPVKLLNALQSPMVRAIMRTLGVTFDLDLAAEALERLKRVS